MIDSLSILKTKLHCPQLTPDLIIRERLLQLLRQGQERPLTMISAPAGYGKSVLARTWVYSSQCPTAWVSLDEDDDDFIIFLNYFLSAINSTFPSLQLKTTALLNVPGKISPNLAAHYLLNDLAQIGTNFILVLDDLHKVTKNQIFEFLAEFVRYPSTAIHLVLISRHDLPLPISSLRAKQKVNEIRAQELRFSSSETAQLLQIVLDREIDEEFAEKWTKKTEGWPTALRLAALSLRQFGREQELHANISNDSRYLQEYLLAEILAGLPEDFQACLLKISILNRFCVSLVEAVGGQGVSFFNWLEQSNLFLVPLDQGFQWYRFHHLFQQMLQSLLRKQLDEGAILDLFKQASTWFANCNLPDEAIQYAVAGGDYESAVGLVVQYAYGLMDELQWFQLKNWLNLIPDEVQEKNVFLNIIKAIISIETGNVSELEKYTQKAELQFNLLTPGSPEHAAAYGQISFLRSVSHYFSREIDQALACAQIAIQSISLKRLHMYNGAVAVKLFSLQGQGNLGELNSYAKEVLYQSTWPVSIKANMLHYVNLANFMEGNLAVCLSTSLECLKISEENQILVTTSFAKYGLCAVYYLRNQFAEATPLLQAHWVDREVSSVPYLINSVFLLALINTWRGNPLEAKHLIDDLTEFLRTIDDTSGLPTVAAFRVELALLQGRPAEAHFLSAGIDFNLRPSSYFLYVPELTPIKLLYQYGTEESLDEARSQLDEMAATMYKLHRNNILINVLALSALVYDALGDETAAFDKLHEALKIGQIGGFIRTFIDLGTPMENLLVRLVKKIKTSQMYKPSTSIFGYVNQLLAAFSDERLLVNTHEPTTSVIADQNFTPPNDPLTRREIQVLKLFQSDLAAEEIADELGIAVNTVYTHTRNIYSKLGVSKRHEAVWQAKKASLI